jgi:hypothetical protein
MKPIVAAVRGVAMSMLVVALSACGPLSLVKSNLPPVLPGGIPPGPTIIHPPLSTYTLAGKILGLHVQGVEAKDLTTNQRFTAVIEGQQEFRFEHLNARHYQLALRSASHSYVLQSILLVDPERPRFLTIEFKGTPEKAIVDGVTVGVETRREDMSR